MKEDFTFIDRQEQDIPELDDDMFYEDSEDFEEIDMSKEDELLISQTIDRIADDEARAGNRSDRISKELIESLVDDMRRITFVFKNYKGSSDLPSDLDNVIHDRVPCIVAVHSKDNPIPKKCIKAKIGSSLGQGIVDDGDEIEVVLDSVDAARIFCENNFIKYRTADAIEQLLRETAPKCFKERKENYINPAAIADPASRMIMSMNIPVTEHSELEQNFETLMYQQGLESEDPQDDQDIITVTTEPIFSHEGFYRGDRTMISIYLCLTKESLRKQSVICPDCYIVCENQVDGTVKEAFFNLKTGYNRKEMHWKADYGSITRKIKKILQDEQMTDFKQQDSNRGKKSKK